MCHIFNLSFHQFHYYFLSACLSQNALKCIVWCPKTNLAGLSLMIAEFLESWYVPCIGFVCFEALAMKQSHHSRSWSVDSWVFSFFNTVQHHCATLSAPQCQLTWHCIDTLLLSYSTNMTMYSETINSVAITTIIRRRMPSCPQTSCHCLTIEGWVIAKMLTVIVLVALLRCAYNLAILNIISEISLLSYFSVTFYSITNGCCDMKKKIKILF